VRTISSSDSEFNARYVRELTSDSSPVEDVVKFLEATEIRQLAKSVCGIGFRGVQFSGTNIVLHSNGFADPERIKKALDLLRSHGVLSKV
jgi:hypothetical protein